MSVDRGWYSDRDRQTAQQARAWSDRADERRSQRHDTAREWPPDPELHPRTAQAWAAVEAALAVSPRTWPDAVEVAANAATPRLTPKSASALLTKACRLGVAHWAGGWETAERTLYLGPGVSRPLGRSAPRRRRPVGDWSPNDLQSIARALRLIDRFEREAGRDVPDSVRRMSARLLATEAAMLAELTTTADVDESEGPTS